MMSMISSRAVSLTSLTFLPVILAIFARPWNQRFHASLVGRDQRHHRVITEQRRSADAFSSTEMKR